MPPTPRRAPAFWPLLKQAAKLSERPGEASLRTNALKHARDPPAYVPHRGRRHADPAASATHAAGHGRDTPLVLQETAGHGRDTPLVLQEMKPSPPKKANLEMRKDTLAWYVSLPCLLSLPFSWTKAHSPNSFHKPPTHALRPIQAARPHPKTRPVACMRGGGGTSPVPFLRISANKEPGARN